MRGERGERGAARGERGTSRARPATAMGTTFAVKPQAKRFGEVAHIMPPPNVLAPHLAHHHAPLKQRCGGEFARVRASVFGEFAHIIMPPPPHVLVLCLARHAPLHVRVYNSNCNRSFCNSSCDRGPCRRVERGAAADAAAALAAAGRVA